jgi:hypothetical protein
VVTFGNAIVFLFIIFLTIIISKIVISLTEQHFYNIL